MENNLTPRQIVEELDKYIIGQDEAKRNVAIALRNRWRRMNADKEMREEIIPNNILMIGTTGVGKTEIARRLARIVEAPFVKVEASKFTEVGYVGRDVEGMIRDLVEQSVSLVKTKKKKQVLEKAEQIVEELILDALIPPVRPKKTSPTFNIPGGVPNKVMEEIPQTDYELNEKTREKFREKIRNKELDNRKIEVSIHQPSGAGVGMIGGGMMDESSMINLQEMLNGMLPKKSKKKKVSIADARKILLVGNCPQHIYNVNSH